MAKKSKQDTASANLRNICLNMLSDTLDAGKFSNIVMDRALKEYTLSPAERSFLSRLYLGVIERLIYIDYIINAYSSVNTQKMKPVVLNILRMSVYQLKFMDAVPDYAVVSEALSLCEARKLSGLKGFVNGLLRAIIRNDKELNPPANVLYSVPKWMYELVESQYGKEAAESFFEDSLKPKDYVV
ncbi:MAG: 16S rRNA (cytosine(967)-C(5))-methyltransferase, partial [Parasporobacterium sp.]|nr:16S rRNA (cytosine(967)-C(5))-methyltransferase [Parasporobacterium sp.]